MVLNENNFVNGMEVMVIGIEKHIGNTGILTLSTKTELGKYKLETKDGVVLYGDVLDVFEAVPTEIKKPKKDVVKELRKIRERLEELAEQMYEDKSPQLAVDHTDTAKAYIRKVLIELTK